MNSTVPNVIGMTETQAKDALIGYTIQVEFQKDTSKADGVVLKQSLASGTSVKKGSTIVLTINDLSGSENENTNNTTDPSKNTTTNTETNTTTNTTTNTNKNETSATNSI